MSTCSSVITDVCLPVLIDVEEKTFSADSAWVAGAFFLGLFLGALLAGLLVKPCLASWEKKKRQDAEAGIILTDSRLDSVAATHVISSDNVCRTDDEKEGKKKKKRGSRFKRKKHQKAGEGEEGDMGPGIDVPLSMSRGMVDVVVQTTSSGCKAEMADQDMDVVVNMEKDMDEEKETLMLKTLAILLRKQVVKKNITEPFYQNFMKKTEEEIKDVRKIVEREMEEAEEELRKDNKLSKDTQAMEAELQKLQTQGNNKLSKLRRGQRDKIRLNLIRSSGMSEAEVEALMEKLMKLLAVLEAKLGKEHARQKRALEERLARRRQVVEYKKMQQAAEQEDVDARGIIYNEVMKQYVLDGKLLERQKNELLDKHQRNLNTIKTHYDVEALRYQEELAEKLRIRRLKRMQKLAEKQAKERASYIQTADKNVGASDFLQNYHSLITRQHLELEEVGTELDETEVQELDKAKKELLKGQEKELDEEDTKIKKELEMHAQLSENEALRLLKLHRQQMEAYKMHKQREREVMMARLQEKLAQRLEAFDEQELEEQAEMEKLKEQQTTTLHKVLATNMELTDDAKERILHEHQQNMQALSNQLQKSKLRQQKSLEIKLNQRKARIEELRRQQEENRRMKRDSNKKELEKLEKQLEAQIAAEEQQLELARQAAIADLRKQLAAETEEALRHQDEEIGLLIGRFQVGQARRAAILQKQDKTLKEIQDKLETKMTEGVELPISYTDQLIQQHYNNVSHLNDQIQRNKERQERMLSEKIQTKKLMKEKELETKLEEEADVEYYNLQQRGAGIASAVLTQNLMEQRHNKAMRELEREIKTELEKSKEELNQQLESDLQQELVAQKQQLLTQLAAVSNLSKDELNEAVDSAVTETGGNQKAAKKLAKDLRIGIERAKTSMGTEYGEYDENIGMERPRSSLGGRLDLDSSVSSKRGLKKKKKPLKEAKPAFVDEDHLDENYSF